MEKMEGRKIPSAVFGHRRMGVIRTENFWDGYKRSWASEVRTVGQWKFRHEDSKTRVLRCGRKGKSCCF